MHYPERTLFIGDIHGCYSELMELLDKVKYSPSRDRLISLGDLIHKGPHSGKVLEYFYKNKLEVVMGNHEWHLLEALRGNDKLYPEGKKILNESSLSKTQLLNWLEALPFFIKDRSFLAVHASFDPSKKKYKNSAPMDMISSRYFNAETEKMISNIKKPPEHIKPWYEVYPMERFKERFVLFGHWAGKKVRSKGKVHCLDTGCCYGGKLTCFSLPDASFHQVSSHQERQFNY